MLKRDDEFLRTRYWLKGSVLNQIGRAKKFDKWISKTKKDPSALALLSCDNIANFWRGLLRVGKNYIFCTIVDVVNFWYYLQYTY